MKICLHIGLHKTGSTSIQSVLSAQRDALLQHGVDFPLMGQPPGSPKAHRYFPAYMHGAGHLPEDQAAKIAAWRPSHPLTIISAEGFSRSRPSMIEQARAYFEPDTRVVCALRDPVAHMRSHHRQRASKGVTVPLSAYLSEQHAAMISDDDEAYYRYDDNMARWEAAFPLTVLTYDGAGDIVGDFLRTVGIDHLIGDYAPELVRKNATRDDFTAATMRFTQRMAASHRLEAGNLKRLQKDLAAGAERIKPALRDVLVTETVDFRAFKADFARVNPAWATLLEGSKDEVEAIAGFSLNDEALLGRLSDVLGRPL